MNIFGDEGVEWAKYRLGFLRQRKLLLPAAFHIAQLSAQPSFAAAVEPPTPPHPNPNPNPNPPKHE